MDTQEIIESINKRALRDIEEALKSDFDDKAKIDLIRAHTNEHKRLYKNRLASVAKSSELRFEPVSV